MLLFVSVQIHLSYRDRSASGDSQQTTLYTFDPTSSSVHNCCSQILDGVVLGRHSDFGALSFNSNIAGCLKFVRWHSVPLLQWFTIPSLVEQNHLATPPIPSQPLQNLLLTQPHLHTNRVQAMFTIEETPQLFILFSPDLICTSLTLTQ